MFSFDFDLLDSLNAVDNTPCLCTVVGLDGREYNFNLPSKANVGDVKALLEKRHGIPAVDQRLCQGRQELSDDALLTPAGCRLSLVRVKKDWSSHLLGNPFDLSSAPQYVKADKELVRQAAKREISVIAYAAAELRADEEFAVSMVKENGFALQYFSPELRRNRMIALAAVGVSGSVLRFVDESLQADEDIVLAAVQQDAKALLHASPSLVKDAEFSRRAVANNRLAAEYVQRLSLDSRSRESLRRQEEADKHRYERDIEDSKIFVDAAYALYQRGAVFLDARSNQEFDRSHIFGALPFSEQTSMLRHVIMHKGLSTDMTSDLVMVRLRHAPDQAVVVYSDSGSDDVSLGYISRCVRVAQELRRACRIEPSLGSCHRVRRLVGGLNQWKRAGYPTEGEQRPLINDSILLEGGIHACLGLDFEGAAEAYD